MKKTHTILVLVIAVGVNLCFAHSTSSSYTFNGPFNHNDIKSLKATGNAGAPAHTGYEADTLGGTGALAGATAFASAGVENIANSGFHTGFGAHINGSTAGACLTCKGPFPGPSGSIFDSKPAHLVPLHERPTKVPLVQATVAGTQSTASYQPSLTNLPGPSGSIYSGKPAVGGSATSGVSHQSSGLVATVAGTEFTASYQPSLTNLPGPSGSIYSGKPAVGGSAISGVSYQSSGHVSPSLIATFPGPSGSIHDSKPVGSGTELNTDGSHSGSELVVGLACSNSPDSPNKCGSGNTNLGSIFSGASAAAGVDAIGHTSVEGSGTELNTGSHSGSRLVIGVACNNSPGSPNKCGSENTYLGSNFSGASAVVGANSITHTSVQGSVPSIHPQTPTGIYYINKPITPSKDIMAPLKSPSFSDQIHCLDSTCELNTSNKDSVNHDAAHQSGGIVFENEDTYNNVPITSKPIYKNSEQGGYAVSTDEADNSDGVLVGPGTGHLPVESDSKPFGTQGAFGGSAAFVKGTVQKENKSFETQGFGLITGSRTAQTSGPGTGHLPVESDSKPFGTQGAFGGSAAFVKGAVQEENKSFETQGFGNSATLITGSRTAQTSGSFASASASAYAHAGSFAHKF